MKKIRNSVIKARKWAAIGCILVGIIVVLATAQDAAAASKKAAKPNIVLIFMDNFGYGELHHCSCSSITMTTFVSIPMQKRMAGR